MPRDFVSDDSLIESVDLRSSIRKHVHVCPPKIETVDLALRVPGGTRLRHGSTRPAAAGDDPRRIRQQALAEAEAAMPRPPGAVIIAEPVPELPTTPPIELAVPGVRCAAMVATPSRLATVGPHRARARPVCRGRAGERRPSPRMGVERRRDSNRNGRLCSRTGTSGRPR